jgi:hypothetical protein
MRADVRRVHDRNSFQTRVELAIMMAQAARLLLDVLRRSER